MVAEIFSTLKKNKIFNPEASSSVEDRKIILGETTNIIQLNRIKYQWAYELYKTMSFSNFWIPEEINMIQDKKDYNTILSEKEKWSFELVLSFLIALDSYQVNMLKEFARYFTSPELILVITAQEFQEGLHSYSYQYILESIADPVKTKEVYEMWREDCTLFERNKVIAEIYDNFIESPNLE
ncbi:MAG: ribonucleotide-diphosphate reductase subunit beta, partial [Aquificaceae bacterium]|nr:ribonucleotide-diphosphate reductase subunit beta [Aquificaceae bacterium]